MHSLNAAPARRLSTPRVKHLRPPGVRRLDLREDRRLRSPVVRELAQPSGRGFLPGFAGLGLVEDLDETEVQVGYEDSALAGGMMPGLGAFDFGALMTPKNLGLMAAAAGVGYLLFKRK